MELYERLVAFLETGRDPDHPEEKEPTVPSPATLRHIRAAALIKAKCDPEKVERAMATLRAAFDLPDRAPVENDDE